MPRRTALARPQGSPDAAQLTPKQRAFLEAYSSGTLTAEKAAIAAGYSERSARNEGPRLLRNPLIQQLLYEHVTSKLGTQAVKAAAVVERLMTSARSEYVQLEAAKDWLDRAGFKPADKVDHRLGAGIEVTLNLGGGVEN
jgi:hypothetical protein